MQLFNYFFKISLFLLILSSNQIYAATCNNITGLNGTSTSITKNLSNDTTKADATDYFKFTTNADGTLNLQIEKYNNKEKVKFSDNKCNGNKVYQENDSNDVNKTFQITAGKTYYIKIQEKNKKNKLKYKMTLDFTVTTNQSSTIVTIYN